MKRKRATIGFRSAFTCVMLLFMLLGVCAADVIISPSTTAIGKIIILTPNATDTAAANGTALLAALAGISASWSNQYLLKLGPGIYDIGTSSLIMKSYVDIEGAGENTTTIQGNINSATSGVINGADFAELRLFTVNHYGGGANAKAIYIHGTSPKITSVTVNASGGSSQTTGIEISTTSGGASPELTHVKVRATSYGSSVSRGIDINGNSFPTLIDIDIMAANGTTENSGIYLNGAQPRIRGAKVQVWGSGQGTVNYGVNHLATWSDMSNMHILSQGPATAVGVYTDTTGILRINHSDIDGETVSISNGTAATIGGTKIWRGVTKRSGSISCAYCYSDSTMLDIDCNTI